MLRSGELHKRLTAQNIRVVNEIPEATLETNVFGYPKGLVHGAKSGRTGGQMNVLIGSCGSSAADKIPELVERCVAEGFAVKLVTSKPGEHFFKDFGINRIRNAIGGENIYRDDDEWNFEYVNFGMPVRACHLALREWADVMVVAPLTCNSMAKCAAGVGDTLITSVFIAWQYHKKTLIVCPACNTDMWNNKPTQRNVQFLKHMGIEFMGPRVAHLTNGQLGVGCMEMVDAIMERLRKEDASIRSQDGWFIKLAKRAAADEDMNTWDLILRAVQEKAVDINLTEEGAVPFPQTSFPTLTTVLAVLRRRRILAFCCGW